MKFGIYDILMLVIMSLLAIYLFKGSPYNLFDSRELGTIVVILFILHLWNASSTDEIKKRIGGNDKNVRTGRKN